MGKGKMRGVQERFGSGALGVGGGRSHRCYHGEILEKVVEYRERVRARAGMGAYRRESM